MKSKFHNEKVTTIFDHALRLYRTSDFDSEMKELRKIHKKAYRYLTYVHKWSQAYCSVCHYSMMTTNFVESMNSILRFAHKLLITTLVEFVRDMVQQWFYERRNVVERTDTMLTKWASEYMDKNLEAT